MDFGTRDIDSWIEVLSEVIGEQGQIVFRHRWDSGGPGAGAGAEIVYKFRDLYWPCSGDAGVFGPMETLEEALAVGDFLQLTDATTSIDCREVDSTELVEMLTGIDSSGLKWIDLNGETWVVTEDGTLLKRGT
jgi:hypothetical protein